MQVMRLSFQHPTGLIHADQVKMVGGVPVFAVGTQETDFKVTVAQLETLKTDQTRVLLLNSPSNPTGMIYTAEELLAIGGLGG